MFTCWVQFNVLLVRWFRCCFVNVVVVYTLSHTEGIICIPLMSRRIGRARFFGAFLLIFIVDNCCYGAR
jgi:hypothetical protein